MAAHAFHILTQDHTLAVMCLYMVMVCTVQVKRHVLTLIDTHALQLKI